MSQDTGDSFYLECKAPDVQMRALQQPMLLKHAAQVSDRRGVLLFHHLPVQVHARVGRYFLFSSSWQRLERFHGPIA